MSNVTEAHVQAAIIDALVYDGWLLLRVNQGGRHSDEVCPVCRGAGNGADVYCSNCNNTGKAAARYTRFAFWQMLGQEPTDKGISDLLAVKKHGDNHAWTTLLAIECKAPGKKANVTPAQQAFLDAVQAHGGIGVVADSLEDIAPYLDRVEV